MIRPSVNTQPVYVGRFAPSPTGPLHFGSLVAALASFLDARYHNGRWLLRIEDLDPPREDPSAPDRIIHQLTSYGLLHDGEVLYQSTRNEAYDQALATLASRNLVYPCNCSRKSIDGFYSGQCRHKPFARARQPYAVRVQVDASSISINDRCAGTRTWRLDQDVGDFIIKRKDGLIAYQLAVVVDDEFQGITHIVRGNDLLDSTPRQYYLGECLGYTHPRYMHIPLVLDDDNAKLSKQTHAEPVPIDDPLPALRLGLRALGQRPTGHTLDQILNHAILNWDSRLIPAADIPLSSLRGPSLE